MIGRVFPGLTVSVLVFFSLNAMVRAEYTFDEAELGLPAETVDLSLINSGGQLPGIYNVTVWINDKQVDSRDIEFRMAPVTDSPVTAGKLVPCLMPDQLLRYGVDIRSNPGLLTGVDKASADPDKSASTCTRLSGMNGATTEFDFNQQKLQLIIPPDMMLPSTGEIAPRELWNDGIPAVLLSYQYNIQRTVARGGYGGRRDQQYLQLRPGINVGAWRMRSVLTRQTPGAWVRQYAWAERRVERLNSQLTLGEQFSSGLGITDGVPFRGVQLMSDDAMLPYAQRTFSPVIEGVAGTQARVEVSQNGYVLTSVTVPAGAFRLDRLPSVSTDGDLLVTIFESDGTRRSFTVPYTTPAIAGYPGTLRYSLLVGQYRSSDPAVRMPGILVGEMLYGLPVNMTVYSGFQTSEKYHNVTLGSGTSLGVWGALSVDGTYSDGQQMHVSAQKGQRLRVRYTKSIPATSSYFSLSAERMSEGYRTLSDTLDSWCRRDCGRATGGLRQRLALNMSQGLSGWGRIGMNVSRQTWRPDGNTQVSWGGNYTVLLRRRISLSLSWTRSLRMEHNGQRSTNNIVNLMLSVPLGSSGLQSSLQMTHAGGKADWQVGLQGMAMDNRLVWTARERTGGTSGNRLFNSASLGWSGRYGTSTGYFSDSAVSRSYSVDTRGGMLLTRHGLTAGPVLGDTVALMVVPGVPDVATSSWQGVKTDWRGYAIVPYLQPYIENSIEIRPDMQNQTAELEYTSAATIPTKGAVTFVPFPVRRGEKLLLTLTQRNGGPVPFGAVVTVGGGQGSTGIVDEGGEVYLPGVDPKETVLTVRWGREAGETCTVKVDLSKHKKSTSGLYRFSGLCG
ncbi:fimbrial biogenesis outer membrane usher protein [Salmonella enterica subsp. enterica serovar Abaetetuba]|nr:fimbrial biogenesis outer membrane usher protein [Salmonella enterica subsp. enterica serovar Abaetetuba]EJR4301114.1 fimbrial biogenesis outer membrane usher protein [Salmonella enterica]